MGNIMQELIEITLLKFLKNKRKRAETNCRTFLT